jgi:nucleotide-binding universal stress UspA family protein
MDFTRILFPVDFSGHCEAAVAHVRAVARRFGSSITLLHVIEYLPAYAFDVPSAPESYWQQVRAEAVRSLHDLNNLRFTGLETTQLIRQGDVATEIVKAADEIGAGLIMIPTRGHGRFRAALLGSVAAKVLHDAHCPVWTSAHPEQCEPTPEAGFESILCAVGLGAETASLIRAAAELGARTGATVRLVHAVPGEENPVQRSMDLEFARFLMESAKTSIASLQRVCGTAFDVCMEAGKPSRVIAAAARHHEADLVVIGHGKLHTFAGQFLTHAYSIVRDSPCPVLSL